MESRPGAEEGVDGKFGVPITDSPPPAPSSRMSPRIALASLLGQAASSHDALLRSPSPVPLSHSQSLQPSGRTPLQPAPGVLLETVQHPKKRIWQGPFRSLFLIDLRHKRHFACLSLRLLVCPVYTSGDDYRVQMGCVDAPYKC